MIETFVASTPVPMTTVGIGTASGILIAVTDTTVEMLEA